MTYDCLLEREAWLGGGGIPWGGGGGPATRRRGTIHTGPFTCVLALAVVYFLDSQTDSYKV